MPFRNGAISYARFKVVGDTPNAPTAEMIESMRSCVVQPPSVGVPPETQAGFCAGRHVYDVDFEPEVMSFGPCLLFGMRLDTNRVPAELKKAYRAIAEQAAATDNPTGMLNRVEKKAARDEAEEQCRRELSEGRHRVSRMTPVLWDLSRNLVLAPAFSDLKVTALSDLFHTCFDCNIQPLTAGTIASEWVGARGLSRSYEDAVPASFMNPPEHAHSEDGRSLHTPVIPWARSGPEPSDFLGNEFLIWLWYITSQHDGIINLAESNVVGELGVALDRSLDMECAWDATGSIGLRADGPTRLPEAGAALKYGKWPRKSGLVLGNGPEQWTHTFQADRCIVSGLKINIPDEEPPTTERELIETRLESLDRFDRSLMNAYSVFLSTRFDDRWPNVRDHIANWIQRSGRKPAPAAMVEVNMPLDAPVEVPAT